MTAPKSIPLVVVSTLAIVVVAGVLGMIYLACTKTPIPDQLDRIVTVAIGALGAILATTRGEGATPVNVVNEGVDEAIPTTDATKGK